MEDRGSSRRSGLTHVHRVLEWCCAAPGRLGKIWRFSLSKQHRKTKVAEHGEGQDSGSRCVGEEDRQGRSITRKGQEGSSQEGQSCCRNAGHSKSVDEAELLADTLSSASPQEESSSSEESDSESEDEVPVANGKATPKVKVVLQYVFRTEDKGAAQMSYRLQPLM